MRWLMRLLLVVVPGCAPADPISVDDPLPELWSADFDGPAGPLAERPEWAVVFGGLVVSDDGAVVADGNPEDGNDDYLYRHQEARDLTILAEVHWDEADGVGVELVVPPGSAHESLYELAIWQDQLALLRYDGGGDPSVYQVLESSGPLEISSGAYALALRARFEEPRWRLVGELRRGSQDGELLATVGEVRDRTHGASIGQGVGIYDRSGQASRIRSLRVLGR